MARRCLQKAVTFYLLLPLLIFLLITTQSGLAVLPKTQTIRQADLKLADQKAIKDNPALDIKQEAIYPELREALQGLSTNFSHFFYRETDKGDIATKEYTNHDNEDSNPKASADRHCIKLNGQMDPPLEKQPYKHEDSNAEITLGASSASPTTNKLGDYFNLKALGKEHYEKLKLVGEYEVVLKQFELKDWDYMDNSSFFGACICRKKNTYRTRIVDIQSFFDNHCPVHIVKDDQNQLYVRLFHGTNLYSIDSLSTNGIQAWGNGQLGRGFYLSSNFLLANLFAYIKATNYGKASKKAPGMIIETWVPFDLKAKQVPVHNHSDNDESIYAPIEQEPNTLYKFVFRDGVLHKLKTPRAYITKY
jgi:hypothetical protein